MRTCVTCGTAKPASDFYGRRKKCKPCYLAQSREWQVANRERINARARERGRSPEQNRKNELARWGLTPEAYDALLVAQGGVCAICKEPPLDARLAVDHDHACCDTRRGSCGECVRGLLCGRCNAMIAMAQDNPHALLAGVEYLAPALFQALGATVPGV